MKQIDRIKNMTTDEMAEYLDGISKYRNCTSCCASQYCYETQEPNTCKQTIKDYLESEVKQ